MIELIEKFGLPRTLKSIFPNLSGIDFENVKFDQVLNQTDPLNYLSRNIDDNWYFGIGNMAMVFKTFKTKTNRTKTLNKLLKDNDLKKTDGYKNKANPDVMFWGGNGFKIEVVNIENVNVILITNEETFTKESVGLKTTELAQKVQCPKWIRGINDIYDGNSPSPENKNYSNFTNTPLLFEDDGNEYIIIKVSSFGIGKKIIDDLISKNGGKSNFNKINNNETKEWEYFHEGKIFSVGYLKEYDCVRINGLPQRQTSIDEKPLERGIHPLSDKINKLIKGLNSPIYNPAEGGVPDGRFYAVSPEANVIVSFSSDSNFSINKFNEIILEHNPDDKVLKITNKSVKEWLDQNQEDFIEFNVDGKFQMHLSKGNANYRINLYPGGGLSNKWNFNNKSKKDSLVPESSASKLIQISEEKVRKTPKKVVKKENTNVDFFKKALDKKPKKETAVKKEYKKLKDKLNIFNKDFDYTKLKRFLKYLILLLLFLFIYRSCFYDECRNNAVCYYKKALDAESKAEFDMAFDNYKKAIRVDRKYIDAYNSRGLLHQKLENHEKAIKDFTKIIEIDNENWLAYHHRGNSYTEQGDKKYSIEFKRAMKDYDKSIEINSSNQNGMSFFKRGLLKEKIEIEACDDFVYSCDRSYTDGCDRYANICYPKNGSYPLVDEFGRGVFGNSSRGKITLDNTNGDRDLVVVIRRFVTGRRDGPRIRAQFLRKGQVITMDNIPNGTYYTQDYYGEYWIENLNPKNRFLRGSTFKDYKNYPFNIRNNTMKYTYGVTGGQQGDEISEDKFFN